MGLEGGCSRKVGEVRVSPEPGTGDEGLDGERGQTLGSGSTSMQQLPPLLLWSLRRGGRACVLRQHEHEKPLCSDAQIAQPPARLLLCN